MTIHKRKTHIVPTTAVLTVLVSVALPSQASYFSIGTENIKLKNVDQATEREFVADTFAVGLNLKAIGQSSLSYDYRVERDKQTQMNQVVTQKISIGNAYSKNQEWSFKAGIAHSEIVNEVMADKENLEFIGIFGSAAFAKPIVSDHFFLNINAMYEAYESREGEGKFDVATYASSLALRVDNPYIGLLAKVGYQYKKSNNWLDSEATVTDGVIASIAFYF